MTPEVDRRARRLAQSGLLDVEFWCGLRGQPAVDPAAAARDYVAWGMPRKLPPSPFLDFAFMPPPVRAAWRRGRVGDVLAHLASAEASGSPWSALFDPARVGRPLGGDSPYALVNYLATAADSDRVPAFPGVRRAPEVGRVRGLVLARAAGTAHADPDPEAAPTSPEDVGRHQAELLDWDRLEGGLSSRVAGRTSVVVPTFRDWRMTLLAVTSALDNAGDEDVEVVVVDNGSPLRFFLSLATGLADEPDVRCVRLPHNLNFAGGSNVGFARSTGDVVVFLNNDTYARRGWLPPLRQALTDPSVAGVQSLLLYPDETIQAAGTLFVRHDLLPTHALVGHPKEDAATLGDVPLPAVTAAAVALRSRDVVRVRGFDPGYRNGWEDVDLCLRLGGTGPGGFRVAPASVVTHFESRSPGRWANVTENRHRFHTRWRDDRPAPDLTLYERLGLRVEEISDDGQEVPAARLRVGRGPDRPDDRLRWTLNLPSTGGHWGDTWGDTFFAESLAARLRSLGQDVVTHATGRTSPGPAHLDDVALAVRGRQSARRRRAAEPALGDQPPRDRRSRRSSTGSTASTPPPRPGAPR